MARSYLRASRGARRLKLSPDEIADHRRQALDFAMGAFWQAMHWSDEAVANDAIRIAIEVHIDSGREEAVKTIFTTLLNSWGMDAFKAAVDRPYTAAQLEDVGAAFDGLDDSSGGDIGSIQLSAKVHLPRPIG